MQESLVKKDHRAAKAASKKTQQKHRTEPQNEVEMTVPARTASPHWIALASAGLIAAALAPTADAGRRSPAPITYAGDAAPATAQTARETAAPRTTQAQAPATGGKRIEFRYPDQPEMVYGAGGARPAETDAPIAFSSSTAAISPNAARQYAHLDTPQAARQTVALDPAITAGGFDARATAARIAAQAALPPHQPASVEPVVPTPPKLDPTQFSTRGETVQPSPVETYEETGLSGVYGDEFQDQPTANGERFDQNALMAAHPSLPLPSLVQVINQETGAEVVVRVNDRGPFVDGRLIDVSRRAGELLGIESAGTTSVQLRYLGPAPLNAPEPVRAVAAEAPSFQPVVAEMALPALPPVQAPPVVTAGNYFVQLGAFADIGNAERMTTSLGARTPVEIVHARVRGADFFRVWVGPYPSMDAANRMREDFRRRGVADGMVVSR